MITLDATELDRQFQGYADLLKTLLWDLTQRCQSLAPSNMFIGGLAEVLRQPEFSELQQAQTLIHLLEEEQQQLRSLIHKGTDKLASQTTPSVLAQEGNRVNIRIGSENLIESIQAYTLVSSIYQKNNVAIGSVGVLGPTRMAYEKVIALVSATAKYLSDCLGQEV